MFFEKKKKYLYFRLATLSSPWRENPVYYGGVVTTGALMQLEPTWNSSLTPLRMFIWVHACVCAVFSDSIKNACACVCVRARAQSSILSSKAVVLQVNRFIFN